MDNPHVLAALYFAPPVRSFWRWNGDAQVLSWADGTTIAFRAEVDAVLRRLAGGGLPPFPALVLLLASCRDRWQVAARRSLLPIDPFLERPGQRGEPGIPQWLSVVLDSLETVSRLPPDLRTGAEAKALLAEVVFENGRSRGSPQDAALIVQAFSDGVSAEALAGDASAEHAFHGLLQDLESLREGVARLDAESLALRKRTGLDHLVEPARLELAPSECVRRLLVQLREDRELAGLSRLAHDLMAAVHVPRTISAREEMPVGGVSDLSNRGTLDRLLVSELAHDDVTFAVRVAMNEALYLRRESPPRTPPGRRLILLDAGIRTWGIPRLFSTAVALAFAATAGKRIEVRCYRGKEDGLEPVDLGSREGLVAHLSALESSPHPGPAVEPFLALMEPAEGPSDAILVTHEDVTSDPEFQAALLAARSRPIYVATVARDGAFRLQVWSGRGGRTLREARLSLEDVHRPPSADRPGTPLMVAEADPALPVIFSRDPFPLLLPHFPDPRWARWSPAYGVVMLTADGRVLNWKMRGQGAHQVTAFAPRGAVHGVGLERGGLAWFVVRGYPGPHVRLLTADLSSGRCSVDELAAGGDPPVGVTAHLGALFLVYRRRVDVFDLRDGRRGASLNLSPGLRWRCGRFFYQAPDRWHALAYDGMSALLEPVQAQGDRRGLGMIALFDRIGHDGPWGIAADGSVSCIATGERLLGTPKRAHGQVNVLAISDDGHRVVVRVNGDAKGNHFELIDLNKPSVSAVSGNRAQAWLLPEIWVHADNPHNLRRKLRGLALSPEGTLVLLSTKSYALELKPVSPDRVVLSHLSLSESLRSAARSFTPCARPARSGIELQRVAFPDGTCAYLDSRGLLHWKSSDPGLPELSLVLFDQGVAAWASDGARFGPRYFHPQEETIESGLCDRLAAILSRVRR